MIAPSGQDSAQERHKNSRDQESGHGAPCVTRRRLFAVRVKLQLSNARHPEVIVPPVLLIPVGPSVRYLPEIGSARRSGPSYELLNTLSAWRANCTLRLQGCSSGYGSCLLVFVNAPR